MQAWPLRILVRFLSQVSAVEASSLSLSLYGCHWLNAETCLASLPMGNKRHEERVKQAKALTTVAPKHGVEVGSNLNLKLDVLFVYVRTWYGSAFATACLHVQLCQ